EMPLQGRCVGLTFFVALAYMGLSQAAFTPGCCACPRTQAVKGRLSDFQVFPKRPSCDREELVVTRINPDDSTQLVCMSTEGVRGKRILSCWESINRNESCKLECLHAQPIRKPPPPTPTTPAPAERYIPEADEMNYELC
uniref:Chemokine interleukin-8-like domain-containing protein n=1 Tax=Neolamprologus brichardi TaxID=32507 RepID=A0A3Q4GY67_NEOBR